MTLWERNLPAKASCRLAPTDGQSPLPQRHPITRRYQ